MSLFTLQPAIYPIAKTRGGFAAKQVERELAVTYETAWRMCQLISSCLNENQDPFSGEDGKPVEIDETYVGRKMKGGKRGWGSENKTPTLGIVGRKGKIKTSVVKNAKKATLQPVIEEMVEQATNI